MRVNTRLENSLSAWGYRLLMGPAFIADGVVSTLTIGFVSSGFALNVARLLARSRIVEDMKCQTLTK